MKNPKVGIALAAYQPDPKTFVTQLESISEQSYPHWFCVVTLDSSLGSIRSHIEKFIQDPRFFFSENPTRLGTKKNFEHAARVLLEKDLEIAYLAFSDQDDIWYPNKLFRLVKEMAKMPPLSLVHSDMNVLSHDKVDTSITVWNQELRGVWNSTTQDLVIRNVVAGAALLMDIHLWKRFPVIPDEIEFHDRWAALIAAAHGGVYPIHEPLYAYRIHDSNVLGMTPYQGFIHGGSLALARQRFQESYSISLAMRENGLGKNDLHSYLFHGLKNLLSDPALARACFARALGKLCSFFSYFRVFYLKPVSAPTKENTAAVVVTFNPDAEFNNRLSHLKTHFDKIVVIDNHSATHLSLSGVKQLRLPENLGVGVAFNEGAREASEEWKEAEWFAFFDQDSELAPNYLSEMSEIYKSYQKPSRIGVIGCNYIERATGKPFLPAASSNYRIVSHCITSGSLARSELWNKSGGYNESLFIDHVDDEYCFRVRAHGFEVLQSTLPLMTHRIGTQVQKQFLWRKVWVWNHSPMRWFYFTRNLVYLWRSYGFREAGTLHHFSHHLLKRAIKMLLLESERVTKLKQLLLGLCVGSFSFNNPIPMRSHLPKRVH